MLKTSGINIFNENPQLENLCGFLMTDKMQLNAFLINFLKQKVINIIEKNYYLIYDNCLFIKFMNDLLEFFLQKPRYKYECAYIFS